MIEVQWHRVMGTSHFHSFIKITPDDRGRWKYNPYIQPSRHSDPYMTIGAGSKYFKFIVRDGNLSMGVLTKGYNRPTDWKYHHGKFPKVSHPGNTENEFIWQLMKHHDRFNAKLDYDTFPRNKNRSRLLLADDGYNSNSYVAGLLIAVGSKMPPIEAHVSGRFKPVPKKYFQ